MPNQLLDEGYKVYALCEHGYTYSFLFYSGETKNEDSEFTQLTNSFVFLSKAESLSLFNSDGRPLTDVEGKALYSGFSPTAQAWSLDNIAYGRKRIFVCHYRGYACIENKFARTDSFGIAQTYATIEDMLLSRLLLSGHHCAAGTRRANRAEFPKELDISKGIECWILEWNQLSAVIVNGIRSVLWQDNNLVLLLTTIHDVRQYVLIMRRKPKKSSINAASTRKPFAKNEHRKLLPIPELISDYNQFMGGVDIAD
ncbi:hypothetical protein P167DRAFT_579722 [Morchella conica CCBAS932]|uniref:Uncharacterized protein n=1 Tax=Morchella conica CCBAS932 TaxID=1392247 RepID=A0A3N4K914_9PEZI|nr:hypothetical protein P167DRAFT_579722 [Morchella conica CCBAS932]